MKRVALYIAAFVFSFLAFVVAFAPARAIWPFVRDDVQTALPNLEVAAIDGTVWNGTALLRYRDFPETVLTWSLSPLQLLTGHLRVDAHLDGNGIDVTSLVMAASNMTAGDATGNIESTFVNVASAQMGLRFSGTLRIEGLALASDNHWFTRAAGTLRWEGGPVQYNAPDGYRTMVLPALDGALALVGSDLTLTVRHQTEDVILIALQPSGWASVDIKARLFMLAGLPVSSDTRADMSIIRAEEQLFPGIGNGQ